MDINIQLISFLAVVINGLVLFFSQEIPFIGGASDNLKQINAAASINQWKYFSDMHKYSEGKAWMKDTGILFLAIIQKITGHNRIEYMHTVMCAIANFFSTILIYLICFEYWGLQVATNVSLLYLISMWPCQIIIQGTYHGLSQLLMLLSIFFIQQADGNISTFYFISGVSIGLMLFSSASSRKYCIIIFSAFCFSLSNYIFPLTSNPFMDGNTSDIVIILNACLLVVMSIALFAVLIKGENYKYYLKDPILILISFILASLFLSRTFEFYLIMSIVLLGAVSVFLLFWHPKYLENIRGFVCYSRFPSGLQIYRDYLSSIGIQTDKKFRGAGLLWLMKFSWRIAPIHFVVFVFSLLILIYMHISGDAQQINLIESYQILLVGISPILLGEITGSPQLARTYFPGFIGILIFIAYVNSCVIAAYPEYGALYQAFFYVFLFVGVLFNVWLFVTDVFPARMAVRDLLNFLKEQNIKKIYTFDIPYDDGFVGALKITSSKEQLEISFINKLDDIKDGFVLIPPFATKKPYLQSYINKVRPNNNDIDPNVERLIESGELKKYTVIKFKTLSASRIWPNEGEVTSYRDLILGEVSENDLAKGHAWLIEAGRL